MITRTAKVCGILRQGDNVYYNLKQVGGDNRYLAIPFVHSFVEAHGCYPPPVFVTFHGPYLEEDFTDGDDEGTVELRYMVNENKEVYPKEIA